MVCNWGYFPATTPGELLNDVIQFTTIFTILYGRYA